MNLICIDFETFFSDDYTLKKMTTEAYIRDPRFEALCCSIRGADDVHPMPAACFDQEELSVAFAAVDWRNTACIAHHAQFDGLILSHHFGCKPALWIDTLSMARMVHGKHLSVSLAALAKHYGLDAKSVPYDLFKGRRWADLDTGTRQLLADGCNHDVDLTWAIAKKILAVFPQEELVVVDTTVRMFTEPLLEGNAALFETLRDKEFLSKGEALLALNVSAKDLASATKFAALLEAEGVEVEYKTTPAGNEIPAVAKSDMFMKGLCDDSNTRVAALADARLEAKSTLAETRSGRLADMSQRGPLCVYLSYCGAHTTRWSGGDKVNFQNLPRGAGLRTGVRAPDGWLFGQVDQSQGECRMLNWLAGQWDVVERFERKEDPYVAVASAFYGRPITKADTVERQFGKVMELQCGFGSGAAKIKASARNAPVPVILTDEEALRGRDVYRSTHPWVVNYWKQAEQVLHWLHLHRGDTAELVWGPMVCRSGKIYLPNGTWLDYTTLHADEEGQWRLKTRYGATKYYGAKLVENVVQALSRVITSQALIVIRAHGFRIVGMAHDDLWVLVPEDGREPEHLQFLIDTMARQPSWAPGLPLAADGKLGETYG